MSFTNCVNRFAWAERNIDDGKHGILAEVDNPNALAEGMMSAIRDKHNLDLIYKRSHDLELIKFLINILKYSKESRSQFLTHDGMLDQLGESQISIFKFAIFK